MTNKKWFFNVNGQVTGPFDPTEVEELLTTQPEALLWGRGFSEWMKKDEWLSKRDDAPQAAEVDDSHWRYRIEGKVYGPYKIDDLVQHLQKHSEFEEIDISTNEGPWKEIFTIGVLADRLGLSRRAHNRVPILGTAFIESQQGTHEYKAITISEGGLGLSEAPGLRFGEKVRGSLKSANLFIEVHFVGEIVYVGKDGYVGVKFNPLPQESQSAIVEYVKKFKNS